MNKLKKPVYGVIFKFDSVDPDTYAEKVNLLSAKMYLGGFERVSANFYISFGDCRAHDAVNAVSTVLTVQELGDLNGFIVDAVMLRVEEISDLWGVYGK